MKKFLILILTLVTFQINAQCWKAISQGGLHSAAIKADGTLWAWGLNNDGQIGDGTIVNKLIPTQIGTDTNWKSISCGGHHTLALKTDGTLWGWGDNSDRQIGNGTTNDQHMPIQIGSDTNWFKLGEQAEKRSFAIKTDGTLWGWGNDDYGSLGNGDSIVGSDTPTQIGTDTNWKSVSSGFEFTVGLKSDGTIWTWGSDYKGALGNGAYTLEVYSPTQVGTSLNWKSASAGSNHVIAVKTDGTLWGWGWNVHYQLGNNSNIDKNSPIQIGTLTDWDFAYAGFEYSMAKKNNGSMWSWGYNYSMQLGSSGYAYNNLDEEVPVQIGNDLDWDYVGPSYNHTMGLKNDGSLWIWGGGYNGAMGNGTIIGHSTPVLLQCPASTLGSEVIEGEVVFNVYPNPVKNNLSITNSSTINKIEIFNLVGQKIFSKEFSESQINLDLSDKNKGIYFVKLFSDNKIQTRKIIKD